MVIDTEARVERLLDKLEDPNLSATEAREIERRIAFVQGLATRQE